MRHSPTALLFGTFVAYGKNCLAQYVRGLRQRLWYILMMEGLVRCACHQASARALHRFVPRELPARHARYNHLPSRLTKRPVS
jgi:hypothetical protein